MKKFQNYSQSAEPIRKLDQPVHKALFFGTTVRVLGIVCVSSQSFKVRIVLHLFFWIPDSMRKILQNFENFSQSDGPVRKLDQPVH